MRHPLQLLADCPECRVESAVVELYDPVDPASVMGLPAESHCRLCGAAWRAVVYPGPANTTGALAYRGGGLCPGCGLTLDDASLAAHSCTRCGCHARRETVSHGADLRDHATLDAALARFAAEEQDPDVPAFVEHNFAAGSVAAVHAHNLTVVTRNVADFAQFDVRLVNPFATTRS